VDFLRRKKQELRPCPRCHQLLEADVPVCDMCGFDMRELQSAGNGASSEERASARAADDRS